MHLTNSRQTFFLFFFVSYNFVLICYTLFCTNIIIRYWGLKNNSLKMKIFLFNFSVMLKYVLLGIVWFVMFTCELSKYDIRSNNFIFFFNGTCWVRFMCIPFCSYLIFGKLVTIMIHCKYCTNAYLNCSGVEERKWKVFNYQFTVSGNEN